MLADQYSTWAEQVSQVLSVQLIHDLIKYCIGVIIDTVEFVANQSKGLNVSKAKPLDWWKGFISNCKKIKLSNTKTIEPILTPKLLRYLDRLSPTLL